MGRQKIQINRILLKKLYTEKKLSPYKIASLLGCNFGTVRLRLKEYRIPLRSRAQAQMRYSKWDFSKNPIEAAYLLGLRLGDLNVYIPKAKKSETIVVRCHTTDLTQVKLLQQNFNRYGHAHISQGRYGYHINIFLNNSFKFLLPKQDRVKTWIKKNNEAAKAFIAGYIDAEGNFIINQGKARFKIDSYDCNILHWIYQWFTAHHIRTKLRLIALKGQKRKNNIKFNADLWRLNVNEALSLEKMIKMIKPHLKHKRRLSHANKMLKNIKKRKDDGTI